MHHPSAARPLRSALSALLAILLLTSVVWLLVGWIASTEGESATSAGMIRKGLIGALVFLPLLAALRPHRAPGLRPLFVLALGLWPFLAFGAFLQWQIQLSAEQTQACLDEDDAKACEELARKRQRRGNYEDALRFHAAACALNAPRACVSEAALLQRGLGVDMDRERALERLTHACVTLEHTDACRPLADLLLDDEHPSYAPERARSLLTARCAEGDAEACERLRLHFPPENGTSP